MNIVLIGYRCVGKSSVGKKLASCLHRKFVDTDDLLQERQQAAISEIVDSFGWEHFRKMEKEIIEEIAKEDDLIIAVGGGAVLDPENVMALKKNGMIVWLKANRQVLHKRMVQDPRTVFQRPPLTGKKALEELEEVMASRAPFYEKAMEAQLDTSAMAVEAVAEFVLSMLQERKVI